MQNIRLLLKNIPDSVIESLADVLLPDLLTFYESEEGQKQFEEWKAKQSKGTPKRDIR